MTDPTTPASNADAPHSGPPESRTRSLVVVAIVAVIVSVAFAMVTLIYIRWLFWTEPTSMIVVEADAAAAGALIEVSRSRPDGRQVGVVQEKLSADNGYVARFFLEPGLYQVNASRSDRDPIQYPISLQDNRIFRVSLAGRFPATAPATTAVPALP